MSGYVTEGEHSPTGEGMDQFDKLKRFEQMLAQCDDKPRLACELIAQEWRPYTATRDWENAGRFAHLCFELAKIALGRGKG